MNSHKLQSAWSELPPEILNLIYQKLSFADSFRFSGVCKNWRNINKFPWMLLYHSEKEKPWTITRQCPKNPDKNQCVSTSLRILPSLVRIFGELKTEDFAGIDVIASKRGWVLLTDRTRSMFCCCDVFSSDAILLPGLSGLNGSGSIKAAFSDIPTSRNSVIFIARQDIPDTIEIRTYGRGDKDWSNNVFHHTGPCQDVVYVRGKFYCIFTDGIRIFDRKNKEFQYYNVAIPKLKSLESTFHLAESDGEILLMLARDSLPYFPMWKLDMEKMEFEEMKTLGGGSFLLSFGSTSICVNSETELYSDKVFYPGCFSNLCIWSICMHDRAHMISEFYPWDETMKTFCRKLAWIEPCA